MSNALMKADDFGVTIPPPNDAFTSTVIHPRNLAIQARQQNARRLTRAELVQTKREMKALRSLLNDAGYYQELEEYKALKQRYKFYNEQLLLASNDADRAEQSNLIGQVRAKGLALSQSLAPLQPHAARHQELAMILEDHALAIERLQAHQRLNKEMAKEAGRWKNIMIDRLTMLGFCHEGTDKKGKHFVDKVQFSEVVITPDADWYKLFVTQKTWFGHRSVLPKRVRVQEIVDDKTLEELSIACQRQVTAEVNYANGVWLKVNRIGTTDGLLNYVTLQQVLNSYPHDQRESMPIPIGVGEGRNISWIMLAEHPHFLVAGSSGNGKSNLTRIFICSLIQFQSPEEIRMCFIDLKEGAEFAAFEDIPHLLMPVVKQVEDAVNVLAQMDALRGNRMKQIADAHCRDIGEYNKRHPEAPMPRIAIFIDEYARVKARGKEFEAVADRAVGEITALGRAAGVHLFAATQTPYARILPGEAKNNMSLRLALAVATIEASKSIVGNGDAYKLNGDIKGRAIVAVGSTRWEIQVPFVQDEDQFHALEVAREWAKPAAEAVALPDTIKMDRFDWNELLDISINQLGGNLGAMPLFKFVKDSQTITLNQLREMIKKNAVKGKEITFEGERYRVGKKAAGLWLFHLRKQGGENQEPDSGEEAAIPADVLEKDADEETS